MSINAYVADAAFSAGSLSSFSGGTLTGTYYFGNSHRGLGLGDAAIWRRRCQ